MFLLNIIVILSAILNFGFSATQCNSDQIVEFNCQDPTCMDTTNGELVEARFFVNPKGLVNVVGYNNDKFLVKNKKGILEIVPKNKLRFVNNNKKHMSSWNIKVQINKNTLEFCEKYIKNNDGDQIDSKSAHIITNTDETIAETIDVIDTPIVTEDVNISLDKNDEQYAESITNETNYIPLSLHNDINGYVNDMDDDSIEIESEEDESNMDVAFVDNPLKMDSITAENLVNESSSVISNQNLNSDPVNPKNNNINEKINQDNTNLQNLENDSSAECSLGSCVEETHTVKQEESIDNISPTNMDSSYQQNAINIPITQKLPNVENTDNSINNIMPHTSNVISSLSKNYNTEEVNIDSSHQQPSAHAPILQHLPHTEISHSGTVINVSSNSSVVSQNLNTVSVQNNDKMELNETEEQGIINSGLFQNTIKTVNQQGNNNIKELSSLEKEDEFMKNDIVDGNISPVNPYIDNLPKFDNPPIINEIPKQLENGLSETKNISPESLNSYEEPESQNTLADDKISQSSALPEFLNESDIIPSTSYQELLDIDKNSTPIVLNNNKEPESLKSLDDNLSNIDSTTLNNNLADDKMIQSPALPTLTNEIGDVPSSYQTTIGGEVDVTEILNEKSIDKCTPESGCLHSIDIPKYSYESVQHQNNLENNNDVNVKTMEPDNNGGSKEFEPKSFVASFGHPDTCSGVSCLKFKRNVDKTIKIQSSKPIPKQIDPDSTSHSVNTNLEKENQNTVVNLNEQSSIELSLFDHFQNWISSPTLNTIDFLWDIFGVNSKEYNGLYPNQSEENQNVEYSKRTNYSELYFIVVAVVTLLFSLIYYKYQKGTYENYLLTLLAAKDQSLLIVEKELSLLKEQGHGNTVPTLERHSQIETMNEHLNKSEDIIASQAIRIEKLELEVEELTESGMEMHTLLSSSLESNSKNTEKLNLVKVKLADSENIVAALTQKNFDKTSELEKKNEFIKTLQNNVDELTNKNIYLLEDNGKISSQLEQIITKNMVKESKLLGEINSLQYELDKQTNMLIAAENEVALSKNTMQDILSQKMSSEEIKSFLSTVKITAELKSAKQMSEGYKQKLDEVFKSNREYLDQIDTLKTDITNLKENISKLEENKEESINKLNILTMFFKEQEKEYQKQINEKVMLCDNKEGESSDLNERILFLNQEISNYKSEIQSLKKEITDQEASFKIQISAADKKASDYWISFRQVERKLKEMELETAQLRNKLTMVDKKLENGTKSIDSSKDFEDELLDIPLPIVSPDFTLLDFEPPPPIYSSLQHASVDQRLPPLGALGQASSPPVPLTRRHNRSISPTSPPPSQRSSVFRPLPHRYPYMTRQNSLGHSVESLDK